MHSHVPLFVRVTLVFLAFSAGLASLVLSVPPAPAQGLVSSDLYRFRSVEEVALLPDNRLIAYTVTMRDRPGRPYSQVWIMDPATQKTVRLGAERRRLRTPSGHRTAGG
jgi:hypothetical protein